MGIGYGSNFPLTGLSPEKVGVIKNEKSSSGFLDFLSVFFNILDVAITIGTGGFLAGVAGIANVGIQTGINYKKTGTISPLALGISVGASLIPGASLGIRNFRQGSKIISEAAGNVGLKTFGNQVKLKGLGGAQKYFKNNPQKIIGELDEILVDAKKIIRTKSGSKLKTNEVENKLFNSIQNKTGLLKNEINSLNFLIKDGVIINVKKFQKIIDKAFSRTGNKFLKITSEGIKQEKLLKVLLKKETSTMKFSRISSKSIQWTTKIGGYISSPSSLAADAISKTVGKLTSKIESFGAELSAKLGKWIKKGSKTLKMLENDFEKTGGTLIKSSWIMGFKILQDLEISNVILIQFKNNHPNVIVNLTSGQLKSFITSGSKGRWYINNIARTRGGKSISGLDITGKLGNLMGLLPISKINEIIGFASFSKNFAQQIRANAGNMIWHTNNYIKGFKAGVIQGIISESIKSFVAIGTQNQYAKQFLEGGFGAVSSGSNFGTAFSKSFSGATQSMRDTVFEDTTQAGAIVKNVKIIKGTGGSLKGII